MLALAAISSVATQLDANTSHVVTRVHRGAVRWVREVPAERGLTMVAKWRASVGAARADPAWKPCVSSSVHKQLGLIEAGVFARASLGRTCAAHASLYAYRKLCFRRVVGARRMCLRAASRAAWTRPDGPTEPSAAMASDCGACAPAVASGAGVGSSVVLRSYARCRKPSPTARALSSRDPTSAASATPPSAATSAATEQ